MRTRDLKQILILATLLLAWLLVTQGVCLGIDYYVAPNGNDANPGTSAEPWQTLNRAYTWYSGPGEPKVQEGDVVLFRDGEYGEFVERNISRSDWVTYRAENGHIPVFSRILISNSTSQNAYLRFEGIKIEIPISWYADHGYVTNQPNNWPDPSIPRTITQDATDEPVETSNANFIELKNCTIKGINKYLTVWGFYIINSDDVRIENCDISVITSPHVALGCQNHVIRGNHIHNTGGGSSVGVRAYPGMPADAIFGTIIEGNHIHDSKSNPSDPYYPSDHHGGSGIAIRISNVIIRNNIIHDAENQGIMFYHHDGGTIYSYSNMTVENNLVYDITSYNALQSIDGPCIIRNNTFIGGVRYDGVDSSDNILKRYWANAGVVVGLFDGFDGTGVEIYNNIVVGPWELPDPDVYNYIEDYNLFWRRDEPSMTPRYRSETKGTNSLIAVWLDSGNNLRGYPELFEDLDDAQFNKWTPEYPSGSVHTPFFVRPGYYTRLVEVPAGSPKSYQDRGGDWDYHLADASPGINFGDPNNQPADSLGSIGADGFIQDDGPSRDASSHSIGCYEYASSTFMYGDISGDNVISAYDAALAAMAAVGLITLTDEQITRADVTDNGDVSATDAAWIARKVANPALEFPVEQ